MAQSDSQTGTPVTLVVSPGHTTPGHTTPPPPPAHIPFTGFDLVMALAVAAVLLAAGIVLSAVRRPVHARAFR
jgi:hypothetical protein